MLRKDHALVYEYTEFKQTALHLAAQRDYSEIIQILVDYKVIIDKEDILGRTPLFFASKKGCLKAIKTLLCCRALAGRKSNMNESCLDVCKDI